ncbi:oxygenase MpaB family protein [Subtercola sp. YIM 133946]|uniref:oxygenase MpaB family protein n=1 Tax=Subtercola sp. YIM 133946 TaxID=3118909 RepID=UPI003FCCF613
MSIFPESMRNRLRSTFTGQLDGPPDWVLALDQGDDAGFFAPGSATWAVHGQTATIVAGVRALLIQALHPGALAGVHDWSRYREDPLGRLAGTIRWIFTVTYADTATAVSASNWVLRLHERVVGSYIDAQGLERPYAANDPELLSWVHLAFTDSFLATAKLWSDPIPGGPDAYVREWAKAGELMGVPNPPRSEAELRDQLHAFVEAGILKSDERVAETVKFLRRPPLARSMMPGYRVLFDGAVASIPDEYRRMLGLSPTRLGPVALPTVGSTRLVLKVIGNMLGTGRGPSELAARRRLDRLAESAA